MASIVITFGRIFTHDFETLDDPVNVTENPYFQPVSFAHLKQIWTNDSYRGHYIPLTYTFLAAESILAARPDSDGRGYVFDPHYFDVGSLVLHAACGLLVFAVLMCLVRDGAAACCGALLFALHPLSWFSVMATVNRRSQSDEEPTFAIRFSRPFA